MTKGTFTNRAKVFASSVFPVFEEKHQNRWGEHQCIRLVFSFCKIRVRIFTWPSWSHKENVTLLQFYQIIISWFRCSAFGFSRGPSFPTSLTIITNDSLAKYVESQWNKQMQIKVHAKTMISIGKWNTYWHDFPNHKICLFTSRCSGNKVNYKDRYSLFCREQVKQCIQVSIRKWTNRFCDDS